MGLVGTREGFDLVVGGRLIPRHRAGAPCLFAGRGDTRMDMHRGHFDIEDRILERTPVRHAAIMTSVELRLSFAKIAIKPGAPCGRRHVLAAWLGLVSLPSRPSWREGRADERARLVACLKLNFGEGLTGVGH
jgi:hypothetical protein